MNKRIVIFRIPHRENTFLELVYENGELSNKIQASFSVEDGDDYLNMTANDRVIADPYYDAAGEMVGTVNAEWFRCEKSIWGMHYDELSNDVKELVKLLESDQPNPTIH